MFYQISTQFEDQTVSFKNDIINAINSILYNSMTGVGIEIYLGSKTPVATAVFKLPFSYKQ